MIPSASCKEAMNTCIATRSFAFAHLYNDEKVMDMHIHDCYEIYYSISGGKQFLIDDSFYDIHDGDLFLINQYESHYLTQVDHKSHERIIISVSPEYLQSHSTDTTDLNYCFQFRKKEAPHQLRLTAEEQSRFLYFIHKLKSQTGFGSDILDQSVFLELMVFLNGAFQNRCESQQKEEASQSAYHTQVDDILTYINEHIKESLSLEELSKSFYLSSSYICRIFKVATGTTINKYITAKRITISKALLSQGYSVSEACEECGFNDYSNYLKAFTKAVGISPKKYAQFNS